MATTSIHKKQIREFRVTQGTGLTVGIGGGTALIGGTLVTYAGTASFSLTNNSTRYVELGSDGTVYDTPTTFTSTRLPLAVVVTSGGAITSITDSRPTLTRDGGSSGGGGFSNVSSLVYDADGYLDTFTADATAYNLNYDSYGDVSSVVAGSSTTTITRSPSTGQITSITTA